MKDWNVICDRCGFQYKSYELFREWTGHLVCRKCLDLREFEPRIKPERSVVAYPEPPGINVGASRYLHLGEGSIDITGTELGIGHTLGSGSLSITGTDLEFGNLGCLPFLQAEYDTDHTDTSSNDMVPTLTDTGNHLNVANGYLEIEFNTAPAFITYADGGNGYINSKNTSDYTIEFYINLGAGGSGSSDHRLIWITGTSADSRVFVVRNTGSADYRKIYYRDGNLNPGTEIVSSSQLTLDTWTHVAVCISPLSQDQIGSIYFGGTRVAHEIAIEWSPLPSANGSIVIGSTQAGATTNSVLLDDIRVSPCFLYTGESFTPPARGSLINPP
jgi:hypothetical protein